MQEALAQSKATSAGLEEKVVQIYDALTAEQAARAKLEADLVTAR